MKTKKQNPNCDGGFCTRDAGEVRRLPTGGSSGAILCRSCYEHEMAWRRERNTELATGYTFDLPAWEALKVYPELPETDVRADYSGGAADRKAGKGARSAKGAYLDGYYGMGRQ